MNEPKPKVPFEVGRLSEMGILPQALAILGYQMILGIPSPQGIRVAGNGECHHPLLWSDCLEFTVAQLLELDFEPGEFKYCECCKRLQIECNAERADIYDHNHMYD